MLDKEELLSALVRGLKEGTTTLPADVTEKLKCAYDEEDGEIEIPDEPDLPIAPGEDDDDINVESVSGTNEDGYVGEEVEIDTGDADASGSIANIGLLLSVWVYFISKSAFIRTVLVGVKSPELKYEIYFFSSTELL